MKELEVIGRLKSQVRGIGDDCAVIPFADSQIVFTTDMLWQKTDFPDGTTPYTIGWRTVAVSLSDIAAMGAKPLGVVVALGAPRFEQEFLDEVLRGGLDCCENVDAQYVGGDLSTHDSLTLVSSAIGHSERPILRSGAAVGDLVCVTGELGKTALALDLMNDQTESSQTKANKLLCFEPRIVDGLVLSERATSMMDISDGLARSLHQLAEASHVGFLIDEPKIPILAEIRKRTSDGLELQEKSLFTGEDFELLFTLRPEDVDVLNDQINYSIIGSVTEHSESILLEGNDGIVNLENRGYEHG